MGDSSGPTGVGGELSSHETLGGETSASADLGVDLFDDGEVVHYVFPVEIEVRKESAEVDTDAIVAEALRRLTESIRSV